MSKELNNAENSDEITNLQEGEEKSIEDKLNEATDLSFKIIYATTRPQGGYLDVKEDERITDEVWEFADGLYQEYFYKRLEGRCSLQAMIDFDMTAQEKHLDEIIATFKVILEQVGMPRVLTVEEYIALGYTYTPTEVAIV